MIAAASTSSIASSSSAPLSSNGTTTTNSSEPLEYFHSQLKSIKLNSLNNNTNVNNTNSSTNVYHNDFGAYFVKKLIPHVKSFAYTWFHLQAAKRKHFKNEDKRMNYDDEQQLKQRLMNELPSVKIKWAVRLLMKLRKDIQKMYQKELVDIIAGTNQSHDNANTCKCVISNPDMKGKMRRIDCLRQSDKVWRLDLVMVVLFKGIPLESSDGERLDKLPECAYPQLCINPNHALLNVRDLEVYLANYIKNQSNLQNDIKLDCHKNIVSPSVFTSNEFLTLSNITILDGASENDLKSSLNIVTSSSNSHYSDDNDEAENTNNTSRQLVQEDLDEKGSILKKIVNLQNNKPDENNLLLNQQQQTQQQYYLLSNHQTSNKRPLETTHNTNSIVANSDNENLNDEDSTNKSSLKQTTLSATPKKKKTKSNETNSNMNSTSLSSVATTIANANNDTNSVKAKNLNINEIIEQMKQNESELPNSSINTTDFEIRLSDSTKQQNGKVTKPRKYSKKDKDDQNEAQKTSNENIQLNETSKPISKRRKSTQKQSDLDSQIKGEGTTSRSRKSKTTKLTSEGFKIEDDEDANLVNSSTPSSTNVNTSSQTSTNHVQTNTNTTTTTANSINLCTIEDHSSCSTSSQQDEEIKELLARKNDSLSSFSGIILNNDQSKTKSNLKTSSSASDLKKNPSTISTSPSISFANKIITDELKELLQKERQTTADLFLQLQMLKNKEDQLNTTNSFVNNFSTNIAYMHQNSNSSDISISELANINVSSTTNLVSNTNNTKETSNQQQQQVAQQLNQQFQQRIKSATPVFVDQLLMSPLFNSFMPSCGSSSSSNSSTSTNTIMQQTNSVVTPFSQMAAVVSALNQTNTSHSNKSTPSSSPTINIESGILKLNSNQSSFKRTKENIKNNNNTIKPQHSSNINSSCINALRFDTNSNGSYDELINLANQTQTNEKKTTSFTRNSPRTVKLENQATRFINRNLSGAQTPRTNSDTNESEHVQSNSAVVSSNQVTDLNDGISSRAQITPTTSSSPPPPPPIGTTVIAAAPSPTKLPQFYPYSNSSNNSHIMHRPIPILQKADATLSSLINNLTSSSSLSALNQSSDLKLVNNKTNSLNVNNSNNSNENIINESTSSTTATNTNNNNTNILNNSTDTHSLMNKTPTNDLNELIKINNQQQQIISTLRSNSINNNSPLMFNNHLSMSFNANNNIFSNYPNISPANGMNGAMMGGNGNGSPTSNLFPSITSLFQSPIGTPRVTPTPQHFAAYLFNEDQFHSLIFPSSSLSSNGGLNSDQAFLDAVLSNTSNILSTQSTSSNMLTNFANSESNSNLSPLPIFNNLLSNSLNNLNNTNVQNQSITSTSTSNNNNETILNDTNQKPSHLLSAKE